MHQPKGVESKHAAPRVRYACVEDVALEGQANGFYSFFSLNDQLYSVHRRFNLDLPGIAHKHDRYSSRIILTAFRVEGEKIRLDWEEDLGPGEDPRVVSDGQQAYALYRCLDMDGTAQGRYELLMLPAKRKKAVILPTSFDIGKNWQPFIKDGRLFALHAFSPLTILEIDPEGVARVAHESPTQYSFAAPHDRYTMVRGGSNGLSSRGLVMGLGHLTVTRDDHRPFIWALDGAMRINLTIPGDFLGLRAKGFNIVDPTSLFLMDGRIHLGICASEREWFFSQRFLNLLIELPSGDPGLLSNVAGAAVFSGDLAGLETLPTSRTFIPREMPHQIATREAHGGVESIGEAGCLVHGPYDRILEEGSYQAVLCYVASGPLAGGVVGRFDVSCFRNGKIDTLAAVKLHETKGEVAHVRLKFSTNDHLGWFLETRVFAQASCVVNALSIKVETLF